MKRVDWSELIGEVLETLVITQRELAAKCGVSERTLSVWKTGRRSPNARSRRQLARVAREAGTTPELFAWRHALGLATPDEAAPYDPAATPNVSALADLLAQLPVEVRAEVLAFTRFKMGLRDTDADNHRPGPEASD